MGSASSSAGSASGISFLLAVHNRELAAMSLRKYPVVEFKGKRYLLIGETDGPLATVEQYMNFEPSFAYLSIDGRVMQNGVEIGTRDDVTFTGGFHD